MLLDNSPRADLQRLRQSQSRELRTATELADARQACLARLATIHAEIEGYESEERSRNRHRRLTHQKLANAHFRDGIPKDQPRHLEIARHYAWTQKVRRAPLRRGSPSLLAVVRLRELERLWSVRYGGVLPNDDAGADDLCIAAQLICYLQGDITAKVIAWARVWAPWYSAQEAGELAARLISCRYKLPSADTAAEQVGLNYAERQALGITTIGATDVDPAERERLRRERYNAKRKKKRRDNGALPRETLDAAPTNESLRPWEDKGISRATWYRRRRAARVCSAPSRGEPSQTLETLETLAPKNDGSLQAPAGSLLVESGGGRAENRAAETREIRTVSAGFEEASAGQTPVSSGGSAPVVPGADVALGNPFAPPRPHALCRTTAHAPVEGRGLSVPQNVAPNARLGLKLSSEGRASILKSAFQAWDNCRLCGEPFMVRGRKEIYCDGDCRQLGGPSISGA
jgi:hypothetical protein